MKTIYFLMKTIYFFREIVYFRRESIFLFRNYLILRVKVSSVGVMHLSCISFEVGDFFLSKGTVCGGR